MLFRTVKELVELAEKENKKISEIMIEREMLVMNKSREEVIAQMDKNLQVMEEAVAKGLKGVTSVTGLTGGDAVRLQEYIAKGRYPVRNFTVRCG